MTKVGEIFDGARGGYFQVYTESVNPASIAANTDAEVDVTLSGITTSDYVVSAVPQSLDAGLAPTGARISAANTIKLGLRNLTGSAVDGAARTWVITVFRVL